MHLAGARFIDLRVKIDIIGRMEMTNAKLCTLTKELCALNSEDFELVIKQAKDFGGFEKSGEKTDAKARIKAYEHVQQFRRKIDYDIDYKNEVALAQEARYGH